MSNWLSFPILILAAILQVTFMPQIRILDGTPDLVFLFVFAWSVNAPLETGVTWAFVGGIARDLLSATPLGTSTIGLLLIVFAISQVRGQVYGVGFTLFIGFVIAGTFVELVTMMIVLAATGYPINLIETFTTMILPTVAYNLLFVGPIYWLARRLQKRLRAETRMISQ
jgi:rod shape-determining protein MreD